MRVTVERNYDYFVSANVKAPQRSLRKESDFVPFKLHSIV